MKKAFCSWLKWVVSFSWCSTVFPAPRWAQTTRSRTNRGLKWKWTHPYQCPCIRVLLAQDRRGNHTRWVQWQEGQRFRFRWVREENKSYFGWYPHALSPRNSGWSSPSGWPRGSSPVPARGRCCMWHHRLRQRSKGCLKPFPCWYSEEIWWILWSAGWVLYRFYLVSKFGPHMQRQMRMEQHRMKGLRVLGQAEPSHGEFQSLAPQ